MKWRRSIPAVLLLTLSVPVAEAKTLAAPREHATLSAQTVAMAGNYLRCRASETDPDEQTQAAWEKFFSECDATIRRFARTFAARGVDVDDCTQEVWADLLKALPDFQLDSSRGRFSSWLYTVVRSKATDILRRQMRRPAMELSDGMAANLAAVDGDPSRSLEAAGERAALRQGLAKLRQRVSEKSYQVLHLRQLEGMSVKEVADQLGLSREQVWVREHRMKRKLRDLMTVPSTNPNDETRITIQ